MPAKQKSKLFDEALVEALSHPTRSHAFGIFAERPASTSEIAAEVGEETGAVHHHVQKLLKLGCIEEVSTEPRRGATEHYYRATTRHYFFDPAAWEVVPKKSRLDISMGVLRLISSDLTIALQAGTVDAVDRHLTRTRFDTDEEGFVAVHTLLDDTLEELLKIREESLKRLAKSDEAPMQATVSLMQFELPSRKGKKHPRRD